MTDRQLTSTAKVILGMVAMGSGTGYEMKQLVDKASRFFWAASYGQIYPELKRLEETGLLVGEDDPQGGRTRRRYALTPEGERVLRDWLAADEQPILERRDEGMLKLFFASVLTGQERQALLRRIVAQHEQIAAKLHEIEPAERPAENDFPYLVLDYGIAFHEWSADWYRKLAQRLADRR